MLAHLFSMRAGVIVTLLLAVTTLFLVPSFARAAVSDWQQGVSVRADSTSDFGSERFRQSMQNLAETGASHVGLVVTYYQSNETSHDIQNGFDTPTDESLISAIQYISSLGMEVMIKVHIEPYTGAWRAYINPSDREAWFSAYGDRLVHLGQIAEAHNVESMLLGTEMVSVAADNMHSSNTENWRDMISRVRSVYGGLLAYDANSTHNNDDPFQNEKRYIEFWDSLDIVGLSVYYALSSPNDSVEAIKQSWDHWNDSGLRSFAESVGKPVVFTEVGYRSLNDARYAPWDWSRGGSYDGQEQAHLYEALFSYWNDYPYIDGVYFWEWQPNPSEGGEGETGYTPQHKPAQGVMTEWFSGGGEPPGGGDDGGGGGTFDSSVSVGSAFTGEAATLETSITAQNGLSNGIVDIEVYDAGGSRVFQEFYEGQSFASGESRIFSPSWTPGQTGTFSVAVGVFESGWSQTLHWNSNAGSVTVEQGSGGDGNGGDGDGSSGSFSSDATTPDGEVGSAMTIDAEVTAGQELSSGIIDFEVYDAGGTRVFQQFYEGQNFSSGETRSYTPSWTPEQEGEYTLHIGVFKSGWSETLHWNSTADSIYVGPDSGEPNEPPESGVVEVWWPTNGASISGVHPFKALVPGRELNSYEMYWRVGDGNPNSMYNTQQDGDHKEAMVDVSGWNWEESNQYTVTFVAQESGNTIGQESVTFSVE